MAGLKPIVVVGSINTDLVSVSKRIPVVGETVLGTDFQVHPGGKGANQAVAVARLGYPVRMIGRVGTDSFGGEARRHLANAGVDVECVKSSEGASGIAVICVSSTGENSIIVTPGANASLAPRDLEEYRSVIRDAGIVLAQLEIPLETVECLAGLCARESVPLILDPAPAALLPDAIFAHIAWLTPNQTEAMYYVNGHADGNAFQPRSAAQALLRRGSRGVLLKLGADGAVVASGKDGIEVLSAFHVEAVDTTAAGDAFNGGFAVGLMKGLSPVESARFASAVAGISVTRRGAQPSMPALHEVDEFLSAHAGKAL